jgi:hypothetical protein
MSYLEKYLKYKNKYLRVKRQSGGAEGDIVIYEVTVDVNFSPSEEGKHVRTTLFGGQRIKFYVQPKDFNYSVIVNQLKKYASRYRIEPQYDEIIEDITFDVKPEINEITISMEQAREFVIEYFESDVKVIPKRTTKILSIESLKDGKDILSKIKLLKY